MAVRGPCAGSSCPGLPPPCSELWDRGKVTARPGAPIPSSEFRRSSLSASPIGQPPAQPRSGLSSRAEIASCFFSLRGDGPSLEGGPRARRVPAGVTLKARPQVPDRPPCLPSPNFRGEPGWNSRPAHPRGERGDGGGRQRGHPQGQRAYKGSSEWDRLAWVESQLQHFLAVQRWASDLTTSLITSLHFC